MLTRLTLVRDIEEAKARQAEAALYREQLALNWLQIQREEAEIRDLLATHRDFMSLIPITTPQEDFHG